MRMTVHHSRATAHRLLGGSLLFGAGLTSFGGTWYVLDASGHPVTGTAEPASASPSASSGSGSGGCGY